MAPPALHPQREFQHTPATPANALRLANVSLSYMVSALIKLPHWLWVLGWLSTHKDPLRIESQFPIALWVSRTQFPSITRDRCFMDLQCWSQGWGALWGEWTSPGRSSEFVRCLLIWGCCTRRGAFGQDCVSHSLTCLHVALFEGMLS